MAFDIFIKNVFLFFYKFNFNLIPVLFNLSPNVSGLTRSDILFHYPLYLRRTTGIYNTRLMKDLHVKG